MPCGKGYPMKKGKKKRGKKRGKKGGKRKKGY